MPIAKTFLPGVRSGFIRFGTVPHWILRALDDCGPLSIDGLSRELPGVKRRVIHTQLPRLWEAGFIHRVGKLTTRELGQGGKEQWVYALEPVEKMRIKRLSEAEQMRLWRQRRQVAVASVFDFRGRILL